MTGDRIILYTDGIIEASSPENELWGDERFADFIQKNLDLPPEACADALINELSKWTGQQEIFEDDVTFIIIDIL